MNRPRFRLRHPEPSETQVLAGVLRLVELHPKVGTAWRSNTGGAYFPRKDGSKQYVKFGFEGSPDIHGYMADGRALYIETKKPSGDRRDAQIAFIEEAARHGCVAFFAHSVDDAVRELAAA